MTRTKQMHKNRIVRAAGAENSSNPVALPRTFLLKWGKKVADAANKQNNNRFSEGRINI